MNRSSKFRIFFLLAVLAVAGIVVLAREHRPSILRPDLHSNAYVSTVDGTLVVVDLAKNSVVARITPGADISAMQEHPVLPEIWGLSPSGGYAWILDAKSNQVQKIPLGTLPYSLGFSPDGLVAFATASGQNTLFAIDCASHKIIGKTSTGDEPVQARMSPDGKLVLVVNRRGATLALHDGKTLALRSAIPVIPKPDDVAILPDSSAAFVLSRSEKRLSVVDLRRGILLANLQLAGKPSQMILKPDGGELYVLSPESHGLQAINTWTHEVGDYVVVGAAPTRGALLADAGILYISDPASGNVIPVDIANRRVSRPVTAGQSPGALRFDPGDTPRLLLAVSEASGDLSVIRISADRTPSLLTMIPVGDRPQELAVKLF